MRRRSLLLVAALAAPAACDSPTGSPIVVSVAITRPADTLVLGDSVRLTARAFNAEGAAVDGATIVWTSLDTAVARIDPTGLVVTVDTGQARFVASHLGLRDSTSLTVVRAVWSIALVVPTDSLLLGDSVQLAASAADGAGRAMPDAVLEWRSSDTLAAQVDASGLVRTRGAGTATISATADGATAGAEIVVHFAQVPGGQVFDRLAAGHIHACGLTPEGRAFCWGAGHLGQLGTGSDYNSREPVPVTGGLTFRLIDAGDNDTCGLTVSGAAYCWGDNHLAQVGTGRTSRRELTPRPVIGGPTFRDLSLSIHHAVCAVDTVDEVWCWGHNDAYQVGRRPRSAADSAVAQPDAPVPLRSVHVGAFHTCGSSPDGGTYCWGMNGSGQLGIPVGDSVWVPDPVRVQTDLSFRALALGTLHACGLAADDKAYCWGENGKGELGIGAADEDAHPTPLPVAGGLLFAEIGAGDGFTCGLTPDSQAYCWGNNLRDRLGNRRMEFSPVPVAAGPDLRFRTLDVGLSGACGVLLDGATVCWGSAPVTASSAALRAH